eukprot:1140477-Prymnesium_polylepis.1
MDPSACRGWNRFRLTQGSAWRWTYFRCPGQDCTACWMPDGIPGQTTVKCSQPACNAYFCNVVCQRRSLCPHNVDVCDADEYDPDAHDLIIGEAAAGLGCQCACCIGLGSWFPCTPDGSCNIWPECQRIGCTLRDARLQLIRQGTHKHVDWEVVPIRNS